MLWRLRTSAPWRDLPERYGPWQTVERFVRSETDGTWARLLEHVHIRDDAVGTVQWTVSVDSTINRVHQPAAGARRRGRTGGSATARQALGRSGGGLTTKVHLAVDGRGLPLSIVLTAGNAHDSTARLTVMEDIRIPAPDGVDGVGRAPARPAWWQTRLIRQGRSVPGADGTT